MHLRLIKHDLSDRGLMFPSWFDPTVSVHLLETSVTFTLIHLHLCLLLILDYLKNISLFLPLPPSPSLSRVSLSVCPHFCFSASIIFFLRKTSNWTQGLAIWDKPSAFDCMHLFLNFTFETRSYLAAQHQSWTYSVTQDSPELVISKSWGCHPCLIRKSLVRYFTSSSSRFISFKDAYLKATRQ